MADKIIGRTSEGYVMLARATYKESKTWQALKPEQKIVMITLIMMVNHKDGEWWDKWNKTWVTVKRGQVITSLDGLVKDCGKGLTVQKIRTALLVLEKMQFLTNESTKQNRVITLVNYDIYQSSCSYLTKQPTKNQQSSNKALTTNNNDKNEKNEKKNKDIDDFFESVWKPYPRKEGKGKVSNTQKEVLFKIGYEEISRCIGRYKEAKRDKDKQFLQNGSTFFNSGYVDYLDKNYGQEQALPQKLKPIRVIPWEDR
jgi:hypothetical protein